MPIIAPALPRTGRLASGGTPPALLRPPNERPLSIEGYHFHRGVLTWPMPLPPARRPTYTQTNEPEETHVARDRLAACTAWRPAGGHQHGQLPAGDRPQCFRRSRRRFARHGTRHRRPSERAGEIRAVRETGRARRRSRHRRLGYRPDRRGTLARRE